MAIGYKIDIWKSSSYTRGVSSTQYDRAVRYAIISGLAAGVGDSEKDTELRKATDYFIARYGVFHKLDTTLPLAYLRAERWSPTKAKIYAYYQRRTAFLNHPTSPFANHVDGTYSTEWWREGVDSSGLPRLDANGLPNGRIRGLDKPGALFDSEASPRSYIIQMPTIEIYVPFELSYDPLLGGANPMAALSGKLNSNQFNLYGLVVNPYRAMFNSARCKGDYNPSTSITTFRGGYSYSLCYQGFFRQGRYFGAAVGGLFPSDAGTELAPDMWRTQIGPGFPLAAFPNSPPTTG